MSRPSLRAVVVGAGAMGREWIRTIMESGEVQLVGVVDRHLPAATAAVASLQDVPARDDLDATLDLLAPDLIVNVTVPEAHYTVSQSALTRGIHVLSEKPLCADLADAVRLADVWGESETLLAVSQSRRYNAHMFALRDAVRSLGTPHMATVSFYKEFRPGGFRESMDNPLLLDMAIHPFDGIRFVLGSDPVAVRCVESNPSWSWFRGPAVAHAWFEMSDGSVFSYDGNWCNLGHDTSWNGQWRVTAHRGSALWDGESTPVADCVTEVGTAPPGAPADFPGEGLTGALHEFVSSIHSGRRPMGHVVDNLASLAMVHASIKSAALGGERVSIRETVAFARST